LVVLDEFPYYFGRYFVANGSDKIAIFPGVSLLGSPLLMPSKIMGKGENVFALSH
jgi:hypothetical protein